MASKVDTRAIRKRAETGLHGERSLRAGMTARRRDIWALIVEVERLSVENDSLMYVVIKLGRTMRGLPREPSTPPPIDTEAGGTER